MDRIVTSDEKRIDYYNVRRRRSWKQTFEYAGQAFDESCPVCLVWLDNNVIIHFELFPLGENFPKKKYCNQLSNLNATIQEKRPFRENQKADVFHYVNARPHVTKHSMQMVK